MCIVLIASFIPYNSHWTGALSVCVLIAGFSSFIPYRYLKVLCFDSQHWPYPASMIYRHWAGALCFHSQFQVLILYQCGTGAICYWWPILSHWLQFYLVHAMQTKTPDKRPLQWVTTPLLKPFLSETPPFTSPCYHVNEPFWPRTVPL